MPFKDPERARAHRREKYLENRETILAKNRAYQKANRPQMTELGRKWRAAHPDWYERYTEKNRGRITEKKREWWAANKDKKAEYAKRYREKNKEHLKELRRSERARLAATIRERNREYQRANPDKCKVWRRRCYVKNPDAAIDAVRKRAGIIKDQNAHLSRGLTKRRWAEQGGLCAICKCDLSAVKVHRDHIIPLSKGGIHADDNIQLLCITCNLKKGARLPA